jgi:hypothetical protein
MGFIGFGGWFATTIFLGLLVFGIVTGELRARGAAVFLTLGALAWFGLPYLPYGALLVTSALALIDVALVFVVFKGDVRLT